MNPEYTDRMLPCSHYAAAPYDDAPPALASLTFIDPATEVFLSTTGQPSNFSRALCLALAISLSTGACSIDGPTSAGAPPRSIANVSEANSLGDLDHVFSRVDQEVPGFAGAFIDEDNSLVIASTDTAAVSAARDALERFFPGISRRKLASPRVADYSFRALRDWSILLAEHLPNGSEVTTIDVDERLNRIRVGMKRWTTEGEVLAAARRAQVPEESLKLELRALGEPLVTLTDVFRPTIGGIRIQAHLFGFGGDCTLGFNALQGPWGNESAFLVTNSHCTNAQAQIGGVDSAFVFQPFGSLANSTVNLVGRETADPPFVGGSDPSCPSNALCRYSDAALIKYVGMSPPVGSIARTAFPGTTSPGSSDVVGTFNVVADVVGDHDLETWHGILSGLTVNKIGAATGWVHGGVLQTCFMLAAGADPATGKQRWLLCQYTATGTSASGDSGSPVFMYPEGVPGGTSVWLAGVLHSRSFDEQGYPFWYFSPFSGVVRDLGGLITH